MEPIAEAEEGETIKGKVTPSGGGDLGGTTVTDLIDCHIDELPPGGIQVKDLQFLSPPTTQFNPEAGSPVP